MLTDIILSLNDILLRCIWFSRFTALSPIWGKIAIFHAQKLFCGKITMQITDNNEISQLNTIAIIFCTNYLARRPPKTRLLIMKKIKVD